jgi:hypothetical protein
LCSTEIERVETELKKAREIAYNAQYDLQAQQDATTQVERQLDEFKMAMDCLIGGMEKKGQEDRLTTKTTNPGESTNSKPADLSAKLRTMKNRLGSLESVSALSLSDSAKNTHMVECLSVENMKPQDEIARLKALEQNYFGQQHIEPYTTSATVKKDITPPFQNETTRLQQKNRPTAPMIGGSVRGGHPIYDFEKAESEPLNSVEKGSAEDQKRPSENGRTSHAVQNLQRRPLSLTKGDDAKDEGPKPKNNGAAAGNVKSTLFVENGLVDFTKEAGEDGQEDHEKRKPSDDLGDLYQPMESDLPNIHNEPGFGEVKVSEGGLLRNGNETRPHTRKLSGASSTKVVITGCESDDEEWGSYDALSQTRISSGDLGELAKVLALLSD